MKRIMNIGKGPQMFFDNYIIEDLSGLKRKFQGFQRAQAPFFKREMPWEEPCGPVVATIMRAEDGSYRMWYEIPFETPDKPEDPRFLHTQMHQPSLREGKTEPEFGLRHRRFEYVCYATSKDGVHWERPALNLFPQFGKDNNVVLMGPHDRTNGMAMVYDPDAEPDKRYAGVFQGGKHTYISFSPDGIHWTNVEEPVIPYYNDTGLTILRRPEGGWRLYGRNSVYAGNWQRRIAIYDSEDLIHWDDPVTIMIPENTNDEYYGLRPFKYGDFYVGLLMWIYATTSSTLDCELVFSRDGVNWQTTGVKGLSMGEMGSFDAYRAVYSQYTETVGEQVRTLYIGCQARHNARLEEKEFVACMATIRRDGFCWLDSCDVDFIEQRVLTAKIEDKAHVRDEGHLLTRPFIFDGDGLEINCDASGGYVDVGILDMSTKPQRYVVPDPAANNGTREFPWTPLTGHVACDSDNGTEFIEGAHEAPFEGLSIYDCDTLTEDKVFHRVTWNGSGDLSHLRGKPVRLQIHMRGAKLYSFTVKDSKEEAK